MILSIDESPTKCYDGQVIYEVNRPGREWVMRFLLCKDLYALIKVYIIILLLLIFNSHSILKKHSDMLKKVQR